MRPRTFIDEKEFTKPNTYEPKYLRSQVPTKPKYLQSRNTCEAEIPAKPKYREAGRRLKVSGSTSATDEMMEEEDEVLVEMYIPEIDENTDVRFKSFFIFYFTFETKLVH